METSFQNCKQKHQSPNRNRNRLESSSIDNIIDDDDDDRYSLPDHNHHHHHHQSRLSSIQSTELSLEYHKLETSLTTEMMQTKLPVSNAWNDSSTTSTMNLIGNNNRSSFIHHNINTSTSSMMINNEINQLIFTEDDIWKKDRMTVFCFCATALGAIATLAMYCTE